MTPQEVVALCSIFTAIGALAVSGINLWLTSKARTNAYRDRLHARQLEVCCELVPLAHRLVDSAAVAQICRDRDNWEKTRQYVNEAYFALLPKMQSAFAILPRDLCDSLKAVKESAFADDDEEGWRERLDAAYDGFIADVRYTIGTERLSAESSRLIGHEDLTNAPRDLA